MTKSPYVTALADNAVYLFDNAGNPRAEEFGTAVQMWALCQNRHPITVQDAATAFNATAEVIRQAVEGHPWMYLDGDKIEHDGE